MIVLCGIPSESPLELAITAAQTMGLEHAVFNQRHSHYTDLNIRVEDGEVSGSLRIRETDIPVEEISGIYVRLMDQRELPENQSTGRNPPNDDGVARSVLLHSALVQFLEVVECRVMNRASAMCSNMSKPYQAQLCKRVGFKVPITLISNQPDEVRDFRAHHGRVIYKSISAVRSIVRELEGPALAELERIRVLPTQFQAYVPGNDIRVHVTGPRLFASEIQSEAVDYRYANRDGLETVMKSIDLPPEIEDRCRKLSQDLDLPLCGIDLRRTPDNEYYCFEVNPSPAYSYYQSHTGLPIADGIVEYLAGK